MNIFFALSVGVLWICVWGIMDLIAHPIPQMLLQIMTLVMLVITSVSMYGVMELIRSSKEL